MNESINDATAAIGPLMPPLLMTAVTPGTVKIVR